MISNMTSTNEAFRPRVALQALAPYSTGRDVAAVRRETGYTGPLVKLASNEGAEGPFPVALEAMSRTHIDMQRYPESGARTLRHALASHHGVPPEEVLVTAGGCGALQHLTSALLEVGDEVAYCSPTFHLYRLETLRAGARPVTASLDAAGSYDLDALARAVTARTKLIYVCTPNNPTGGLVDRSALQAFLESLPEHVLPIVDEAYFEYVDSPQYPDPVRVTKVTSRPHVIIRTFSKIFGIAGLRVGYAIAPPDIVAACQKVQNPYEVNRVAQAVALASLNDPEELSRRILTNRRNRALLLAGLEKLGMSPLPSQANFVCLKVGQASSVARALEQHGVIVRPLDAMGDTTSIRVTVGTEAEVAIFLSAFERVIRP
jgi:histidinol-phosphate aminotransferase